MVLYFKLVSISVFFILTSFADTIKNSSFFLEQNENCNLDTTLLSYMKQKNVVSENEINNANAAITEQLSHKTTQSFIGSGTQIKRLLRRQPKRQLSSQTALERRDEMITFLDAVYHTRKPIRFTRSKSKMSTSEAYLPLLKIDIIDNTLLPNDHLFNISQHLPCLKYPPVRNYEVYSTTVRTSPVQLTQSDVNKKAEPKYESVNDFLVNDNQVPKYIVPNDELVHSSFTDGQWYLSGDRDDLFGSFSAGTNLLAAWGRCRGLRHPIVVGLIDNGCSEHPDMLSKFCVSDGCPEREFIAADLQSYKEPLNEPHGTSMAGIIGCGTNNTIFTAGACWNCKLLCLNAWNPYYQGMTGANVLKSYEVILKYKIKVTNASFVTFRQTPADNSAIGKLRDAGLMLVAAAGNENCNIDSHDPFFGNSCYIPNMKRKVLAELTPATLPHDNIVTVSAVNEFGNLADFANYGYKSVDILAPGVRIITITNQEKYHNGFLSIDGTSASTALVAGIIALVWSSNPKLTYQEVKKIITSTARQSFNYKDYCNNCGIINAAAAIEAAGGVIEPLDMINNYFIHDSYHVSKNNSSLGFNMEFIIVLIYISLVLSVCICSIRYSPKKQKVSTLDAQ